ncbi:Protein STRUBBELIG-RECEPTOR FAMILY 6 [Camellia lanceoleosa]|uniref:Protein STRUBBELIG-RECEPTOR FAMILY 6 n=1 Tax=Camellia lanceoleosa TaxID=1840588 RepID=A0ACC0F5J8_9ERIC|nr:Protein STRUBBELIG-RECEPTOR FAMILY 6 [Camellia lanceoleosa]
MDIVSDVSRLRHPNITELVGYCSEHGQHLQVWALKNCWKQVTGGRILLETAIQTPSTVITKTFETSASINPRPPPIDRHKSFDEDDFSRKPIVPIVPKKVHTPPVNAISYSIADLQMATDSFSVETLVGEQSIGCVYRAQFDDAKVLAVKKINSSALPVTCLKILWI